MLFAYFLEDIKIPGDITGSIQVLHKISSFCNKIPNSGRLDDKFYLNNIRFSILKIYT